MTATFTKIRSLVDSSTLEASSRVLIQSEWGSHCSSADFSLLLSSYYLLINCRYHEFGTDGGPAVKVLEPKLNVFTKLITSKVGIQVPEIDTKHVVLAAIVLKGFGGVGFIFGSYAGSILLVLHQLIFTPVLYDFYNYDVEDTEFEYGFAGSIAIFHRDETLDIPAATTKDFEDENELGMFFYQLPLSGYVKT
ncbi:HR-like lesion-inducer [Cynara cardunculus var. scolymus]|uniref:HR-like lesion-inducer n=1 Tax=Cynara cardunculus var. scolymus TaxID=59895 RepID=A0A118K7L6_CYNCS|nr:HR-like lesion-inducer [Cynara cardunculus var. scolymus]